VLTGSHEFTGASQAHVFGGQAMAALRDPELLSEVRQEAERVLGSGEAELLRRAAARRLELTAIS
jgi:hypothetical protein